METHVHSEAAHVAMIVQAMFALLAASLLASWFFSQSLFVGMVAAQVCAVAVLVCSALIFYRMFDIVRVGIIAVFTRLTAL